VADRLPNSVQIGKAIRKKREEENPELAGEELALRAGISTSYLSNIENGQRKFSWEVLAALVEALGVDLGDLITVAQGMPPERAPKRRAPKS
jgi:transcriptional regulator with XRE-family HTH domain